ncbi:MAG TPA: FCD domain-containing protein [Cellulomonas sp.]|nr:FCD domain-containing protein [Cellulomonas sp.]
MVSPEGSPRARATLGYLRRQIGSGAWPVDSKIPTEPELAATLGVGRTTIREAVRSLANLGMLETAAGRGTFVRSRTPVSSVLASFVEDFELDDVLRFRRLLEVEAARQAALRRTDADVDRLREAHEAELAALAGIAPTTIERGKAPGQFHALVLEASGSPLMVGMYAGLISGIRRAQRVGALAQASPDETRVAEHAEVLAAIAEGDAEAAAAAMSTHVDRDLTIATRTQLRDPA